MTVHSVSNMLFICRLMDSGALTDMLLISSSSSTMKVSRMSLCRVSSPPSESIVASKLSSSDEIEIYFRLGCLFLLFPASSSDSKFDVSSPFLDFWRAVR
uniref:Uncharacterized protein n=1 Tax=Cacopsylla melanoneura TaxID=428564 RepID=A0A8D9BTR2_9HEMI